MVGAPSPPHPPSLSEQPNINLCLGGYDGSVAGLSLTTDPSDGLLSLTANFAYNSHINAVRSAAFNGRMLVTGGVDETIRIYDLSRRVERGNLFHHEGTINALRWVHDAGRDLLLSASDDKTICVWRAADWRCLKRLVAHQAGVLDIAPHKTGRLAISVARDRALFMWNLVRGKVAFSVKTKGHAASVARWSPSGQCYLLAAGNVVTVSEVEGRETRMFAHESEVFCAEYVEEGKVVTGGEDKVVRIWDERAPGKCVVAMKHEAWVRDVGVVNSLLFSADSKGGVKIWDVRAGGAPRLETLVGGGDMRLTCMAVAPAEKTVTEEDEELGETGEQEEKDLKTSSATQTKRGKKKREAGAETAEEGTASQRKRKKRRDTQKAQKVEADTA